MTTPKANRARHTVRVELLIRIVAPLLDVVLIVGDRISRILEPDDPEYVTPRMASEGESAPRGLRGSVARR
jgi:hypothetical protein